MSVATKMNETATTIDEIPTEDNNKVVDDDRFKHDRSGTDENQSEKYDISPENLQKSSCDTTPNYESTTSSGHRTEETNNETTRSSSVTNEQSSENGEAKNKSTGFAFTIDFNNGKSVDNRKYKEIAERFQHRQQQQMEQRRHRRGVSLSKLDDSRKSSTSLNNADGVAVTVDDSAVPTVSSKPPFKQRIKVDEVKNDDKSDAKVVLRKPRPTAQTLSSKDSKRHSWSPRSSLNCEKGLQLAPASNDQSAKEEVSKGVDTGGSSNFQPKSTILQRALENPAIGSAAKANAKFNSPLSLRKKSVEDFVVTAPLEYVRNSDEEGSIGDASQATYTLDGDNYTEEEKERMSIDKLGRKRFDLSIDSGSRSDMKNTLQVNYSRDMKMKSKPTQRSSVDREQPTALSKASPKSAKSYLDKFKSRVKSFGDQTFHKGNNKSTSEKLKNLQVVRTDDSSPIDADHGVFTSITSCGVLNKHILDNTPSNRVANGAYKQNLTKFQIDRSEYVQPKVDELLMNSYTDYEKAKQNEYKLNIFSTISSYTSSGTSPVQTDDDNLSVECVDDKPISIKTAPTKNDWIQEWAKNARRRNNLLTSSATVSPKSLYSKAGTERMKQVCLQSKDDDRMSQSYDTYFSSEQFGDETNEPSSDENMNRALRSSSRRTSDVKTEYCDAKLPPTSVNRPPISPTKIPSPMHTQLRARSSSVNRSFRNSNGDLENLDTELYLEKTAAAISSLQKIHHKNNSPQSPSSPMRKLSTNEFASALSRNTYDKPVNLRSVHLHKRNLSLDVSHNVPKGKNQLYDSDGMYNLRDRNTRHVRHNSYENKQIQLHSPRNADIDQTTSTAALVEQQRLLNKYFANDGHARRDSCGSPIRRSSSFCNRNLANTPTKATTPTATKKLINRAVTATGNSLQKSASSSSFKKLATASSYSQEYDNDENGAYYVNGRDNLHTNRDEMYSSDEFDDVNAVDENEKYKCERQPSEPPISHTRYNKAFLVRMEQNRQIASGNKGMVACPNTPELPRRASNQRSSMRDPTSMPRDSSLSRMKQELPNLQTTKKVLTQSASKDSSSSTSSVKQRVLPKYMDISKYKPAQGQTFLKRDESKSTLVNRNEIRKSPSAASLSKSDPMRASGRVKSAGAKPSTPINSKDTKAREADLAMWKRRATYDPMKAAAEGRKKQEEAKKVQPKFSDSAVLRSQSFHSGVGQFNNLQLRQQFSEDSFNQHGWTVMSTESSDDEFGDNA